MDIVKISLLGISGVLLGFLLKGTKPEYAFYLSFGVGILILGAVVVRLDYLYDCILKLQKYLPVEQEHIGAILKMMGISYVGQFSSGICRDGGQEHIGDQIELFSKLAIMTVSMPILLALLETIQGLVAS